MTKTFDLIGTAWVCLCFASALSGPAQVSDTDILRQLPAGARLEKPLTQADLSGRPLPDLIVLYSAPTKTADAIVVASSHVLVFQQVDQHLQKFWTLDCNGAYAGFFPDTGVYDINKTGNPKIVIDCKGTTVCPNFFGVFEYKDGRIQPVPSEFTPLETCRVELRDLDKSGVSEIIDYPRAYGTLPRIFRWDGNKYIEDERRFPRYWSDYGNSHFAPLNPSQPLPLYVVTDYCTLAAKVFTLALNPEKAGSACRQARQRILEGRSIIEASSPQYPELKVQAARKIDAAMSELTSKRPLTSER